MVLYDAPCHLKSLKGFSPEVLVVECDECCEEQLVSLVQDPDGVAQLLVPGDQDIAGFTNYSKEMTLVSVLS